MPSQSWLNLVQTESAAGDPVSSGRDAPTRKGLLPFFINSSPSIVITSALATGRQVVCLRVALQQLHHQAVDRSLTHDVARVCSRHGSHIPRSEASSGAGRGPLLAIWPRCCAPTRARCPACRSEFGLRSILRRWCSGARRLLRRFGKSIEFEAGSCRISRHRPNFTPARPLWLAGG